ncbi:hypothetical protein [Alteriqipengyuania sp.]|uniref:hypothetical protein n=1 Tax=Alteriqipengyuania sp. TaxID=2800692 RepID=UPI0035179DC1
MSYTAKKWLARALLAALLVGFAYILVVAFGDSDNWATSVLTALAGFAVLRFYEDVLKPEQALAPAIGLEDAEEGPTIGTSHWQYYVPATEETIRAALLTAHDIDYGEIDIRHRSHSFRAIREQDGWELKRIDLDSNAVDFAIRNEGAVWTSPTRRTFWNALRGKLNGDSFSNVETEAALLAFLRQGPSGPSLTWQKTTCD